MEPTTLYTASSKGQLNPIFHFPLLFWLQYIFYQSCNGDKLRCLTFLELVTYCIYHVHLDDVSIYHLKEEIFAIDGEIEEFIAYDKNSA